MKNDIEHSKLELEKERTERELDLKSIELDLKREELTLRRELETKKPLTSSPLTAAIVSGFLALVGIGVANFYQSRANLLLEREKAQSGLILKAIETGNPEAATKNLLFLLKLGLINDPTGRIAALEKNPEDAPFLPSSSNDDDGRCSQTLGGTWKSDTSGKIYVFRCTDKSSFILLEKQSEQAFTNAGYGKISAESVNAILLSQEKNRLASIVLSLSPDGKTLAGTFHGEDPHEAGSLQFHKIQ